MLRVMKTTIRNKYKSRLRGLQKELTRESILKSLEKLLLTEGLEGFSVPKVAAQAGTSVKTIYRYFPTRQALLDAATRWFGDRLYGGSVKTRARFLQPDDLITNIAWAMESYDRHPALVKVFHTTQAGRQIRQNAIQHTLATRTKLIKSINPQLTEKEAIALAALFQLFMSSETWQQFKEIWGIDGKEAAKVLEWAAKIFLAEVKRSGDNQIGNILG